MRHPCRFPSPADVSHTLRVKKQTKTTTKQKQNDESAINAKLSQTYIDALNGGGYAEKYVQMWPNVREYTILRDYEA